MDPKNAEAYYERGLAFVRGPREYERAMADFDGALALDPSYALPYYGKGMASEAAHHFKEAIAAYQKFIELAQPKHSEFIQRARQKIRELAGK